MNKIRKTHSAEFKYKVAVEALKEQETLAALSQKFSIHVDQIQKWKSQLQKEGSSLFSDKRGKSEKSQEKTISQLHEEIGLINEIRGIWEKHPFYGYRRIKIQLERQGFSVNRKRVQRLMKEAGIEALYPKPNTSKKGLEHRTYPYLLKTLNLVRSNQVWATDYHLYQDTSGVYLFGCRD